MKGLGVMGGLNIYKEQLNEYTVISNYFIDHYMEDANEAQLQVYFYLLRMASANLPVSVSDISNKFKHSEKDVLRALKYWELQKLLSLDYDKDKNVTGIHFLSMPTETVQAVTPSSAPTPEPEQAPQNTTVTLVTQVPSISYEETEKEDPYVKPSYTADQLKRFKEQDAAAELLFVAQTYVGKPLTVADVKTIYYMWDVLHFSADLIDYLIQYCVDRGKKDFRYMEKVAVNWANEGITTPKQAQKFATKYDKSVYTIMNALGKSTSPTAKELEFIQRWTNTYGFALDIITEACERTVLTTDRNRFEYAEGILSNWKKADVRQKADIAAVDAQFQKQKQTTPKQGNSANRFNQFTQNTYDFSSLEKQLITN